MSRLTEPIRDVKPVNVGNAVVFTDEDGIHRGVVDRYIEGDHDPGFWIDCDDGEERECLFHALYRGEVTLVYDGVYGVVDTDHTFNAGLIVAVALATLAGIWAILERERGAGNE
jgi:hypothetical protein